jgi:hypothetical protein
MRTWLAWLLIYVVLGVVAYLGGSFMAASFNIGGWYAEGRVFMVMLWAVGSGVLSYRLEDAGRI